MTELTPCTDRGGPDPMHRRRCNARTRAGHRCRNFPIRGATRCRMHGASAPQVRAAAERNHARQGALEAAQRLAAEAGADTQHPLDHLTEALATSAQAVRVYADEVAGLSSLTEWSPVNGKRPHVLIEMWSGERDRHARLAKIALDAGLDVRRLELDAARGQMLADAIAATARELGIDVDRTDVRQRLGRNLRAMVEGTEPITTGGRP